MCPTQLPKPYDFDRVGVSIRKTNSKAPEPKDDESKATVFSNSSSVQRPRRISNILQLLLVSIAIVFTIFLIFFLQSTRLYTKEELATFSGSPSLLSSSSIDTNASSAAKASLILLAIGGQVYDIAKGSRKYTGSYEAFLGRDASRAFVTGDFKGDLTDEVSDFEDEELFKIQEWQAFYDSKYNYRGRLIGAFFDTQGKPTALRKRAVAVFERLKKSKGKEMEGGKGEQEADVRCNSRWQQGIGAEVSCDKGLFPRRLEYYEKLSARERRIVASAVRQREGSGSGVGGGGGGEGDGGDLSSGSRRKFFAPVLKTKCICVEKDTWREGLDAYPGCLRNETTCRITDA